MITRRVLSVVLLLAALIAGSAWWLQWQSSSVLREQVALLRGEQRDLAALRAENERLRKQQPSEAELATLRADHAAALRLRTELNTLRDQISAAEKRSP